MWFWNIWLTSPQLVILYCENPEGKQRKLDGWLCRRSYSQNTTWKNECLNFRARNLARASSLVELQGCFVCSGIAIRSGIWRWFLSMTSGVISSLPVCWVPHYNYESSLWQEVLYQVWNEHLRLLLHLVVGIIHPFSVVPNSGGCRFTCNKRYKYLWGFCGQNGRNCDSRSKGSTVQILMLLYFAKVAENLWN